MTHVPDLPGCVAVGESRDEVVALIKEAIDLHIENLRDNGESVPPASSEIELIKTRRRKGDIQLFRKVEVG